MAPWLKPLKPEPTPDPTDDVRATELPCTDAAPVFWLACRMPIPFNEYDILMVPEALDAPAVWVVLLADSAALATDEPLPVLIVLVAV